MKVQLTDGRVEQRKDGALIDQEPGEVITVDNETAKRMIEQGQAEPVTERQVDKAERR